MNEFYHYVTKEVRARVRAELQRDLQECIKSGDKFASTLEDVLSGKTIWEIIPFTYEEMLKVYPDPDDALVPDSIFPLQFSWDWDMYTVPYILPKNATPKDSDDYNEH